MAASSSWCLLATSPTRWPSVSPSRLQQRLPGAVAELGASSPMRKPHGVICMAPQEERKTRRSPLDFPIEWERPKPPRRPDIFPQFSPMKTPLPHPLPEDPPPEDEEEEEEEQQQQEEEEKPDEEEPEKPEQSRMQHGWWKQNQWRRWSTFRKQKIHLKFKNHCKHCSNSEPVTSFSEKLAATEISILPKAIFDRSVASM